MIVIFHKLVDRISGLAKFLALVFATSIFVIILFTIVGRYGFSWVLSWSEEVPRYLLIWVSFLSAAVAVDISDHIAFELISQKLTGRPRALLRLAINVGIFCFGCLMLFYGIGFVRDFGPDMMESIPYTNIWYYSAMPISGGMIALFSLRNQMGIWFGNEGRAEITKFEITI